MFHNISQYYRFINSGPRSLIVRLLRRPFIADKIIRILLKFGPPLCLAWVGIELTNRCNLNCSMCPRPLMKRKQGDMDIHTFRKIVDQSKKYRFPVSIAGFGEPLLYPRLEEALRYLYEHGHEGGMVSTNGLLLDDKNIELVVRYCKLIRVAADSANEDIYKKIRKNDQYKLLCENVKKLISRSKDSGLKIQIQWLKTRLNKDETIDDFKKIFGIHNNVIYYEKDVQQFGGDAPDLRIDAPRFDVRNCWYPYTRFEISWNGDCMFCCLDPDIWQVVGNINENTIMEVWKGARANALRKQLRNGIFDNLPFCKKCPGPI